MVDIADLGSYGGQTHARAGDGTCDHGRVLLQGLPPIPYPLLGTCKLPFVDPALLYSGVSAELLALVHQAGVPAASMCLPRRSHSAIVILCHDVCNILQCWLWIRLPNLG